MSFMQICSLYRSQYSSLSRNFAPFAYFFCKAQNICNHFSIYRKMVNGTVKPNPHQIWSVSDIWSHTYLGLISSLVLCQTVMSAKNCFMLLINNQFPCKTTFRHENCRSTCITIKWCFYELFLQCHTWQKQNKKMPVELSGSPINIGGAELEIFPFSIACYKFYMPIPIFFSLFWHNSFIYAQDSKHSQIQVLEATLTGL